MRTALLLSVSLFAIVLPAQDWTRDAAVGELRELVLTKRPMAEWPERDQAIAAWLDRVSTSGLDLGDHRFLVGVAQYFSKAYEPAAKTLIAALDESAGKLPTGDFDNIVGRALMADAVRAIRAGDFTSPRKSVPYATSLYEDPLMVYRAIGSSLSSATGKGSAELLDELLGRMFQDQRLDVAQRQTVLKAIYAPEARGAAAPAAATRGTVAALKPFDAKDLDGNPISLTGFAGKVVLVDFWATWCGPCMREMPNVVAAHRQYSDKGFSVVGISLDEEPGQQRGGPVLAPAEGSQTVAKIRAAMERAGMTWPVVYEGGGWGTRLAVDNGIRSIPATFLLDRHGTVRYTNLRGAELAKRVGELLDET